MRLGLESNDVPAKRKQNSFEVGRKTNGLRWFHKALAPQRGGAPKEGSSPLDEFGEDLYRYLKIHVSSAVSSASRWEELRNAFLSPLKVSITPNTLNQKQSFHFPFCIILFYYISIEEPTSRSPLPSP